MKNSMVGVVGIAGIGKTTLVNAFKEYYQEKILKKKNSLLEPTYKDLNGEEKTMFLDIACFHSIYASFEGIKNLKKLWLDGCESLEDMPLDLKTLSSLELLNLQHCKKMKLQELESYPC
nr:uncharacterized protein LOC112273212 [Physcomitrium patens]|eukprot:XP_024357456.1 uncharacterized protein LOC112273212 [Physcomitrella patens]